MENMQNMGGKNMCGCPHHKAIPVLVILFGLVFLLGNWGILTWSFVGMAWPIIVIVGGLTKLTSKMCKCC